MVLRNIIIGIILILKGEYTHAQNVKEVSLFQVVCKIILQMTCKQKPLYKSKQIAKKNLLTGICRKMVFVFNCSLIVVLRVIVNEG